MESAKHKVKSIVWFFLPVTIAASALYQFTQFFSCYLLVLSEISTIAFNLLKSG